MQLHLEANDEEILRAVEVWIDDLVRGDYAAAFARTGHDPYYRWTPQLIEAVINGYGLPEPHHSGIKFVVTPRTEAAGCLCQRTVEREEVARGLIVAEVTYDLPLNGEWSDLTATFRVERDDVCLRLVLQEIHVF